MLVTIEREVDGKKRTFVLSEEEIQEVRNQDLIDYARNVIMNSENIIINAGIYPELLLVNEEELLRIGTKIENALNEDCGDVEIAALEEWIHDYKSFVYSKMEFKKES